MNKALPTLAAGARVEIRDEEWVVRDIRHAHGDVFAVRVTGLSDLVRHKDAIFLSDIDHVKELKPEQTELTVDLSPGYRQSRLYLEALLRASPPAGTDNGIYTGHRAAIRPAEYQMEPAAKALSQPRARILMADGVGLGKTIEVGILLSELMRRGRGNRILVVALKSILEQFQQELWARFTIPLVRLDSVGIQRVQSKIPSNMNPFYYFDRAIISIDTLKKDEKYRRYLEQSQWDVIVIDECQNVADRSRATNGQKTLRWRLASLLARTCDSLILTSATPHDGRPESFASLMNLLEPTAVADVQDYTHTEVEDLFIRRFKKDISHQVADAFQERTQDIEKLDASPHEDEVLDCLKDITFKTIARNRNSNGVLFRTTLLKAYLSSPLACETTIDARLNHKDMQDEDEEEVQHDRKELLHLRSLVKNVTKSDFSKYNSLLNRLKGFGYDRPRNTDRVVVFSERIDTLEYLKTHLSKDLSLKDEQVVVFHGSLDDQTQQGLVKSFGTESSPIRILLASDVASEGVNLHFFCHRLVHFDLPWSLITLEQRNGRIDRFGQKYPPEIYYLLTVPENEELAGDLRILERLIEKETHAQKNLGDVAWLLNLHDADKEEDLIGRAIEEGQEAEEVIPDDPKHTDFMDILFGDAQATGSQVQQSVAPSIYSDDLSYAKDGLEEVLAGQDGIIEHHEDLDGFTLYPPKDLKQRFKYLPTELIKKNEPLKLTTDRDLVMRSLDEAREKNQKWPEWQLFWEHNPVAQWLDDRVLGSFTRHSAPVISVPLGMRSTESIYFFQGQISNKRGQPVIIDWFGVHFDGISNAQILSFEGVMARTGIKHQLSNTRQGISTLRMEKLTTLRQQAVAAAKAHMKKTRLDRAKDLGDALRADIRKLAKWKEKSEALLSRQMSLLPGMAGAGRTQKEKRMEREATEMRKLYKSRYDWVDQGMRTNEMPYIRLAAVFVSREQQ